MAVARRIGAGVLLVLATLGLLICLAVIIAVWAIRAPVVDAVNTGIDTLIGYLDLATGDIQQVDAGLMDMQNAVNSATQQAQQGQVAANLATDLAPRVERLSGLISQVQRELPPLENGINAADRLPGVHSSLSGDRLQSVNNSLTQVQNGLNDVQTAIAQHDNTRITAASTAVSGAITDARTTLSNAQMNIAATRASLMRVEEQISRWTLLGALAVTLLFALLGAGQISLGFRAWAGLRRTRATEPVAAPT